MTASFHLDGALLLDRVLVGVTPHGKPACRIEVLVGPQAHITWAMGQAACEVMAYVEATLAHRNGRPATNIQINVGGTILSGNTSYGTVNLIARRFTWHVGESVLFDALARHKRYVAGIDPWQWDQVISPLAETA